MRLPRVQFKVRTLLLLPVAVTMILVAIDPLTARPCFWRYGLFEFEDRKSVV